MKDSGRLTARETSELEHRLLEAARKARVPPEMTLRMSQGLGFGAKAAGASAAAAALKAGGLVVLAAVAVIGVAGTIGGWFGHGGGTSDGSAPAAETAAAAPDGVREELAMLEAARSALASGAADRALQLLTRHDRRYPHGSFRPEATVLRVEALARSGDTEAARALATRFLADHPDSPLAERVGRLAGVGPPRSSIP